MKHKLTSGQTVWIKESGKHIKKDLMSTVVTKVGNKYFEVSQSNGRFRLSDFIEEKDFGLKSKIYLTKEDYESEINLSKLKEEVRLYFQHNYNIGLSYDALVQIKNIITNHENTY